MKNGSSSSGASSETSLLAALTYIQLISDLANYKPDFDACIWKLFLILRQKKYGSVGPPWDPLGRFERNNHISDYCIDSRPYRRPKLAES